MSGSLDHACMVSNCLAIRPSAGTVLIGVYKTTKAEYLARSFELSDITHLHHVSSERVVVLTILLIYILILPVRPAAGSPHRRMIFVVETRGQQMPRPGVVAQQV